jgi:16S rRNA processing protein RimM
MNRFVVIGEVVKAVGLKGEVKLYPLLDFFEPLLDSRYLIWPDGSPVQVHRHRPAGSCEVVKIHGIDDRDSAADLVGRELGFMSAGYLEDDFPRPEGGLPFRFVGRPVVTVAGNKVGRVEEVRYTGGGYLLVIADPGHSGGEILIPAVAPILQPDEGLEGDLVIDPPEGLIDVQPG